MANEYKFNVKLTFFIGLAFFTSEIAWGLYNVRVNQLLKDYFVFLGIVGLWMALDNIIGVIIQPFMGSLSDKTRSKFGRRIPYLIIGIPLAAVFFALIPTQQNYVQLLAWMFFFSLAMGFYRSQAVALMPDFVQPVDRSKGNAIINMMGGLGGGIGMGLSLVAGILTLQGAFLIVSALMIIALIILVWKVKESESYSFKSILTLEGEIGKKIKIEKKTPGVIESFKDILKEKDKSTLFILLAIFCWFIAFQGLNALISIYGEEVLEISEDFAGFLPVFVAIPVIILAYPFALIAGKIGRRNAIKLGLIIMIVSLVIGFFVGIAGSVTGIIIMYLFAGVGWAFINVNSIVIVWELAMSEKKIGTYTGVYYFFSFLAAILGPYILGALTDLFNPPRTSPPYSLLLNGAFFFLLSFILMFFVKRGESELTEEEKLAKQKAIQEL